MEFSIGQKFHRSYRAIDNYLAGPCGVLGKERVTSYITMHNYALYPLEPTIFPRFIIMFKSMDIAPGVKASTSQGSSYPRFAVGINSGPRAFHKIRIYSVGLN